MSSQASAALTKEEGLISSQTSMTADLVLEGLHCKDCAASIEKTVAKMVGVEDVMASFTSGKVKITYNPSRVGHPQLVACVENIGYRVAATGHKELGQRPIWRDKAFRFTVVSGLLLGSGLLVRLLTPDSILFSLGRDIPSSALLFLAAAVLGASLFAREGFRAARNLQFNMNFLMTIAVMGALVIGEYIEAASLAFLFSLAELLEGYAVERARNSLRELIKLAPEQATVRRGEKEVLVDVSEISVGELLVVRPGEKIPLDGCVVDGISSVDQSPITGESAPITKEKGAVVYAGSLNNEGYLEIKTTHRSDETILARIIHLVEDAEAQKAPSERFVEKFAKIYTPTIVVMAVLVATLPPLLMQEAFNPWFIKALTLLVIACPCALVISTPVSVVSALTSASRNGVLIKGGLYLEEMASVKTIAFDKTGTLTKGKLEVMEVIALNGAPESEVLQIAAAMERHSEHPIAKAIMERVDAIDLPHAKNFQAIPGKGVTAEIHGQRHAVGKQLLLEELDLDLPEAELERLHREGKTTVLISNTTEVIGIIAVSDQVRSDAKTVISRLRAAGKRVVMLTGDNDSTARSIAKELGVSDYRSNLLPENKVEEIRKLRKLHGNIAMVGDGINDAPALAAANIGIAMGAAGTDTALETADIALMADDISKLPYLVELSRRSAHVIRQNTAVAILLKLLLAVGVFPGIVTLVVAVLIGDMGASLAVTSNAMRLANFNSNS